MSQIVPPVYLGRPVYAMIVTQAMGCIMDPAISYAMLTTVTHVKQARLVNAIHAWMDMSQTLMTLNVSGFVM